MNFKPSLWKVVYSVVLGIILAFVVFVVSVYLYKNWYVCYDCSTGLLLKVFYLPLILILLGSIIFIYLIWSLVQKKKI